MQRIENRVHTVLECGGFGSHHVDEVARDNGPRIDHYEELVDVVAELAYHNWRYTLLSAASIQTIPNRVRPAIRQRSSPVFGVTVHDADIGPSMTCKTNVNACSGCRFYNVPTKEDCG